ncbi:MAG: hypothetical protein QXD77_02350 [Candidatus Aenigmatarchaeota archaeon]
MSAQQKVKSFEKTMGWDRTPAGPLVIMLKKDALMLNKLNAKHKLVDIYMETIQLANRNKLDLDKVLAKHLKEAVKKYGKVK